LSNSSQKLKISLVFFDGTYKYLELEKLDNEDDVYEKFLELYDVHNISRNNVETLENIESVGKYLRKRPELYKKL
jgi:hypothetical protein